MNGFALGGVAEGFNQARQTGIQQQQVNQQGSFQQKSLQIQAQAQQNQQQRELFARADKDASALMGTATETIKALQLQGKSPAEISKAIQPIVQPLKRLMQSAGRDPSSVDAQIAVTLSQPGFNPASVTGSAPTAAPTQPQSSADVGGTPMPPGQNITGPNTQVTGVDYGPLQTNRTQAAPTQPNDVDRLSTALMRLPATPEAANIRDAIKLRLADAISRNTPDTSVHFAKTEDGNEIPVVIKKQGANVSVTDINGNPYEAPTGTGGSDREKIANAIIEGKQPPVLTGLYKNAKGVRAALADKGFDLATAQQEWQAATKQITSLNGPQMIRYAGLARSVINTIDEIKDLSEKMDLSGVPLANRAKIAAYMQTAGNTEGGQLAARYLGAVTTLKEEFANLAQGGYAPTEAAFALANKQINENFGVKQMAASLTEVQRLIRYRLNGIPNFSTRGPDAQNRYQPGGQQPAAQGHVDTTTVPPPPAGFVVTSPK